MMRWIILLLAIAIAVSGCAGSGGLMPIDNEMLSTVTNGVTSSVSYVADSSAVKELAVHATLQNRDKMIREAHASDGLQLGWMAMPETVFYPGMAAPITVTRYFPTVAYREQAEFNQVLPTVPSQHPIYHTIETIGVAAIQGTVLGMGINATRDVLQSAVSTQGHNTTRVTTSEDNSTVTTDNSIRTEDSSNNPVDNSIGPVDNTDNSIGPVDNTDNRVGPVDNSDNSSVNTTQTTSGVAQ